MKFSSIRILVNDFDQMYNYYKEVLGLECTWGQTGENFASFNIGIAPGISIFKAELMAMAVDNFHPEKHQEARDKIAVILQVENVDESFVKLKSRGVAFINQPKDMPVWGIRTVHFRDREDNLFELYSELPQKH